MKHFRFGTSSSQRLQTVEPTLAAVMERALLYSMYDFGISCGIRTMEEQRELLKNGKTTTLNSRHLPNNAGLSEAVDIMVYDEKGNITWKEKYFRKVAQAVFDAAQELGVHINWGGHWFNFLDMPHFELKKK